MHCCPSYRPPADLTVLLAAGQAEGDGEEGEEEGEEEGTGSSHKCAVCSELVSHADAEETSRVTCRCKGCHTLAHRACVRPQASMPAGWLCAKCLPLETATPQTAEDSLLSTSGLEELLRRLQTVDRAHKARGKRHSLLTREEVVTWLSNLGIPQAPLGRMIKNAWDLEGELQAALCKLLGDELPTDVCAALHPSASYRLAHPMAHQTPME